jgi:hypothetical protein
MLSNEDYFLFNGPIIIVRYQVKARELIELLEPWVIRLLTSLDVYSIRSGILCSNPSIAAQMDSIRFIHYSAKPERNSVR